MRRIYLLLLCSIPGLMMAQELSSNLELGLGGSYSSLGYKTIEPNSVKGGFAPTIHVGYAFYFCPWVGLGVGVDWSMYSGAIALGDAMYSWKNVTDTDGERYDHSLMVSNWKENHRFQYIEVPLSIRFQAPGDGTRLIGELGAKWGLPIGASYTGSGSLTHTGYYEPWELTLHDEPNHGFYTETGYRPTGGIPQIKQKWSLFGKIGVAIPLKGWLDLTIQAYGQYSLNAGKEVGGNAQTGYREDRPGMGDAHYFMSSYSSILMTPVASGSVRPWNVGLEIGLRYVLVHKERSCYPCKIQLF